MRISILCSPPTSPSFSTSTVIRGSSTAWPTAAKTRIFMCAATKRKAISTLRWNWPSTTRPIDSASRSTPLIAYRSSRRSAGTPRRSSATGRSLAGPTPTNMASTARRLPDGGGRVPRLDGAPGGRNSRAPATWRCSQSGRKGCQFVVKTPVRGDRQNSCHPRNGLSFSALERDAMNDTLPVVYVARHGETAWSLSGQHTGRTDLPLTSNGERNARRLGERLKGMTFQKVFTSPLQRASRTCQLAGFGPVAESDPDLVEWDYGRYEGLRSAEILAERPDWQLFRDGCPGGESPTQIGERADRVVARVRAVNANVLLFSSGHFIRVLAARWLALGPGSAGRYFLLSTASLSALGYEHNLAHPVIRLWNDDHHVIG